MADKVVTTTLRYLIDQQALQQSKAGIDQLIRGLSDIGGEGAKSSQGLQSLVDMQKELGRTQAIADVTKQFVAYGKATGDAKAGLISLRNALQEVGASSEEISKATTAYRELNAEKGKESGRGGIGREAAGAAAGIAQRIGGSSLSEPLRLAEDAKRFSESIVGVGASFSQVIAVAGPFALLLGSIAAVMSILAKSSADAKERFEAEVKARQAALQAAQSETTVDLERKRDAIAAQVAIDRQELATRQARYDADRNPFKGTDSAIDDLKKKIDAANRQIYEYNQVIAKGGTQANDTAEKITQGLAIEKRYYAEINSLSKASLEERQRQIGIEQKEIEHAMSALQGINTEKAKDELVSLQKQMDALGVESTVLNERIKPLVTTMEAQRDVLKKFEGIASGLLGPVVAGVKDKAKEIQEGIQKGLEAEKQYKLEQPKQIAEAVKKFNEEDKAAQAAYLQQRADIERTYHNKLIDLARQAAEESAKQLAELERRKADLATSFSREEQKSDRDRETKRLDDQLVYQREEAKATREHQQKLEDIRRQAQDREFELILNRDFAGLYKSRRQTTLDMQGENRTFGNEQQNRARDFGQKEQDDQRQYARERQERQIAYQQQLADAKQAYERQVADARVAHASALQQAKVAHDNELKLAQEKYDREIAMRQQAIQAELRLLMMSYTQRQQFEAEQQRALVNQSREIVLGLNNVTIQAVKSSLSALGSAVSNIFSGLRNITKRADGGLLSAGQMSLVNDGFAGQRESFGGSQFPPGLGLFIPAQSGNVSPGAGRGNVSISVPVTIQGNNLNPQAIGQIVQSKVVEVVGRIFN